MLNRIEKMQPVRPFVPLNPRWQPTRSPQPLVRCFVRDDGLAALMSRDFVDGAWWIHLSISRAKRLPSWEDLVDAKESLLGTDCEAIQVIPKRSEYVNLHPFCLHLWKKEESPCTA